MALIPQVVDAVDGRVPVVAAGGLFDGRGLAASLALGAEGVWIGTRFIATPEAWGTPGYKQRLIDMAEDDTVVSKAFSGKTCRVVRNAYTQHFEDHPEELKPFPAQLLASMEDGANHLGAGPDTEVDPEREFWPAGQGVGAIDELIPAGDLVRQFVAEAEAVFERVSAKR
jgi:enoyl-[acyl-carrier protein] reductase II